jgi:nucleolar pre-ribosomal-associated protein 1
VITATTADLDQVKEDTIVQNLFSAGLGLGGPEGVKVEMGVEVVKAKKAVEELGYRAGMVSGDLGEWVGREKRRYAWDQWKRGQ